MFVAADMSFKVVQLRTRKTQFGGVINTSNFCLADMTTIK